MFGDRFHRIVYLIGLSITLCSLPASIVGVSIGMIILAVNFLLSGHWSIKVQHLKAKPMVWVFVAMYFPVLVSGLFSENHHLGLEIVRLWLPVMLIPPIIAASDKLTVKEFKTIVSLFIFSTLVVTIVGAYGYFTANLADIRKVSPFISHIRLALMVNLSLALLVYYLTERIVARPFERWFAISAMAWFLFFLLTFSSFTGMLMLSILILLIFIKYLFKLGSIPRFITITGFLTVIFIVLSFVLHKYDNMSAVKLTPDNRPRLATVNGNPYQHDTLLKETENGYLVNINICDEELRNEWAKRSNLPYEGADKKGQLLRTTLIRYLASAGLTKDSLGVSKLDSIDIALIEGGYTNTIFKGKVTGIESRLYEFFYEINRHRQTGSLTGGSVLRRLLYAQAALHVITSNPIFGVSYGDLPAAMNQFYDIKKIDLPQSYRYMPHNQYLTVWASAGVIGFIIFILSLTLPFIKSPSFQVLPVKYFWVLVITSMLFEDTMLTHTGISFVAVFSALFLFGHSFPIVKKEDYAAR
ncbi:MAG TPA: O-antigen ligase domain-containing protein [Bacteroidales bacterium]|nr:O-antigen ligase domain-containing protein [Bacteroidales bacterium]